MKKIKWIEYFDEPHEVLGWFGALSILVAYGLSSIGKIEAQSSTFQILNFLGAFGMVVNARKKKAYPSYILNLIWMAIGVYALSQIYLEYIN